MASEFRRVGLANVEIDKQGNVLGWRPGEVRDTFQQIEDHQEAAFVVSTSGIVVLPDKTALPAMPTTLIPKAAKTPVITPQDIPAPARAPGSLPPVD